MIDTVKLQRAGEVKKCSVDRNLQVLRRFFNWAIEQGLAADNPVRRVKFFRADTKRLRYLTEEEFGRLLDECDKVMRSPFLREAIELSVLTGLRRGNLLGLQWEWVDWLNRVVRVPRSKGGKPHACRSTRGPMRPSNGSGARAARVPTSSPTRRARTPAKRCRI